MKKIILFSLLFTLSACSLKVGETEKEVKESDTLLNIESYHNADAKFWNNRVITSKQGILNIVDFSKEDEYSIEEYPDVHVNWLDGLEEENCIVYSNGSHETGVVRFDKDQKVVSNEIIMRHDTLSIDPSILKVEDTYFLTVTMIEGEVNNADPAVDNGQYTVKLYQSDNLKDWSFVGDIVQYDANIEDVELLYHENKLFLLFEKEVVDHGDSSINIISSEDLGKTWGEVKELIAPEGDNEPTKLSYAEDTWTLYFSSDIEKQGESYTGASAYAAQYDSSFERKNAPKKIVTAIPENILLYDVIEHAETTELLFSNDYMGEGNLIVEKVARVKWDD